MPKNENNIQFSLNTEQREKLKAIALGDESIGLTAKRIVLAALGEETKPTQPLDLSELVERITDIEERFKAIPESVEEGLNNIGGTIAERLDRLESSLIAYEDRLVRLELQATSPVRRPSSPPPPPRSRKK
jgi:hypothetical protein